MFPKPDRAVAEALDKGQPEVGRTYEVLMRCEYQRLVTRVAELPIAAKAQRERLDQRLSLAGDVMRGDRWGVPSNRSQVVNDVTNLFDEVQNSLDGKVAAAKGNLYLDSAIGMLERLIVAALKDPDASVSVPVQAQFLKLFGQAYVEAQKRFEIIVQTLRSLYQQTDDKGSGFVYAPGLPSTMAALASGHWPKAHVKVGAAALDGSMPPQELAAYLVHEGSHAIAEDRATIDIVYRNRFAPYYLEGSVALRNAANYEQVVYEVLQGGTVPGDFERHQIRTGQVSAIEKAQVLTASRVTRAWVKSWHFSGAEALLPAEIANVLKDLPQGPGFAPLISAYMSRLFETMEKFMRLESSMVVRTDANAAASSYTLVDGVLTVTLPAAVAIAETAPQLALRLVKILDAAAASPIPWDRDDLLNYIFQIEKLEDKASGKLLADFYGTIL